MKTRRGFTLIELVIVVVIIGILSLAVIPQFSDAAEQAKLRSFEHNCHTLSYAIAAYQAGHDGELPAQGSDLNGYLNGGWENLNGRPPGSAYEWDGGTLTATYTEADGTSHTFRYPS